jgi:hypothetical protein
VINVALKSLVIDHCHFTGTTAYREFTGGDAQNPSEFTDCQFSGNIPTVANFRNGNGNVGNALPASLNTGPVWQTGVCVIAVSTEFFSTAVASGTSETESSILCSEKFKASEYSQLLIAVSQATVVGNSAVSDQKLWVIGVVLAILALAVAVAVIIVLRGQHGHENTTVEESIIDPTMYYLKEEGRREDMNIKRACYDNPLSLDSVDAGFNSDDYIESLS